MKRFDIPLEKINRAGRPIIVRNNGGYVIAGRDELYAARNLAEAESNLDAETVLWKQEEHERLEPDDIDVDLHVRSPRSRVFGELSWRIDGLLTPRGRRL
jgi:hypothetical protein